MASFGHRPTSTFTYATGVHVISIISLCRVSKQPAKAQVLRLMKNSKCSSSCALEQEKNNLTIDFRGIIVPKYATLEGHRPLMCQGRALTWVGEIDSYVLALSTWPINFFLRLMLLLTYDAATLGI